MNFFKLIVTGLCVLLGAAVFAASAGEFSAASVAEGACQNISSYGLLLNNSIQAFLQTASSCTTFHQPLGSKHYYRSIFEWIKRREATSQEELVQAGLTITTVSQSVANWNLYGKTATGVCVPAKYDDNLLGVPNFNCTNSETCTKTITVLGLLPVSVTRPVIPANNLGGYLVFVWVSVDATTLLSYRCSKDLRDWQVWTYGDGHPFNSVYLPEIKEVVERLGFDWSMRMTTN